MKPLLATLAVTALVLGAAGAHAENTVSEKDARLDKLWNQESVGTTAPAAAAVRVDFSGSDERSDRAHVSGPWADNWRAGRKHAPTGR